MPQCLHHVRRHRHSRFAYGAGGGLIDGLNAFRIARAMASARCARSRPTRQLHYDGEGARGVRYDLFSAHYLLCPISLSVSAHLGIEPKLTQRRATLRTWKHDIQRVSGVRTTCLLTAAAPAIHFTMREIPRADGRVTSYDSYELSAPVGKACKLARHASHISHAP